MSTLLKIYPLPAERSMDFMVLTVLSILLRNVASEWPHFYGRPLSLSFLGILAVMLYGKKKDRKTFLLAEAKDIHYIP